MSKAKPLPIVQVDWVDSMQAGGWHKHTPADMGCRSVGILYSKTKDRIVLAQSESAYGCGDYVEIPMAVVKKIRKLK